MHTNSYSCCAVYVCNRCIIVVRTNNLFVYVVRVESSRCGRRVPSGQRSGSSSELIVAAASFLHPSDPSFLHPTPTNMNCRTNMQHSTPVADTSDRQTDDSTMNQSAHHCHCPLPLLSIRMRSVCPSAIFVLLAAALLVFASTPTAGQVIGARIVRPGELNGECIDGSRCDAGLSCDQSAPVAACVPEGTVASGPAQALTPCSRAQPCATGEECSVRGFCVVPGTNGDQTAQRPQSARCCLTHSYDIRITPVCFMSLLLTASACVRACGCVCVALLLQARRARAAAATSLAPAPV